MSHPPAEVTAACPDGGTCHHECRSGPCFRVLSCGPLRGVFPGDNWPLEVRAEAEALDQTLLAAAHAENRARAQALLATEHVPAGQRHAAILSVMYLRAEDGWGNHDILAEASRLGRRWGKYTGANLYDDWTHLLGMLRAVRRKYPNPGHKEKD